jgi:hypothetical protein
MIEAGCSNVEVSFPPKSLFSRQKLVVDAFLLYRRTGELKKIYSICLSITDAIGWGEI